MLLIVGSTLAIPIKNCGRPQKKILVTALSGSIWIQSWLGLGTTIDKTIIVISMPLF